MPYQLAGKNLPLDRPFKTAGTQFPSNWLRLSTAVDREAYGITFVEEGPSFDSRFYTGFDSDGNLIAKDLDELLAFYKREVNQIAGGLLSKTDWMVIRKADIGTAIPDSYVSWRQSIRNCNEAKITALTLITTLSDLITYVDTVTTDGDASADYIYWPAEPAA